MNTTTQKVKPVKEPRPNQLFPRGVVTGRYFINRKAERKELKTRVENGDHTWIGSPRRFGKTSLLAQLLEDVRRPKSSKIYGCMINMMSAYDEEEAQSEINRSIGAFLMELEPTHKKALLMAKEYFGDRVEGLGVELSKLKINIRVKEGRVGEIKDILSKVDQIAQDRNIRVILVFDEFQQTTQLKRYEAVEASIRDAVQHAKNTVYIFSGSYQRILASIFSDPKRPFLKLCRPFKIEKISAVEYEKYIGDASVMQFNEHIGEENIKRMLELTAQHPYYVNALSRLVFQESDLTKLKDIESYWQIVVDEEHHWISSVLSKLSINQLGLLKSLSNEPTATPTSAKYIGKTRIPPSSIHQSLDVLNMDDLIFRDEDNVYRAVDPAISSYLSR